MLDGEVELDDALVGATGNGKHGRGTDQQQVIVAVETGAREAPGRACVRCVPDCSGGPCELFASEHVSIRAQVRADAWNGIRGGLAAGRASTRAPSRSPGRGACRPPIT